ncbi:MAG: hypothetical protein U0572_03985 [Phycisphaerales bacterium]
MQFVQIVRVVVAASLVSALAACASQQGSSGGSSGGSTSSTGREIGTLEIAGNRGRATVQMVDPTFGSITLAWDTGQVNTYRVNQNVIDLRLYNVGDIVDASVAEGIAVYIGLKGAPPSERPAGTVALASGGESPTTVLASTVILKDRIAAVDQVARTLTVEGLSGMRRTVQVAPGVDLSPLKVGDDIELQVTEAVAIRLDRM